MYNNTMSTKEWYLVTHLNILCGSRTEIKLVYPDDLSSFLHHKENNLVETDDVSNIC